MLDGEPSLKDRVIAFFKGAPKRYSFAPEMAPAAKRWLKEYKKLFDEISRLNAGMNAAENVGASKSVKQIERIGRVVENSDNSPKKITRIGKLVENAQKTSLTNINQEDMNVSDERYAIKKMLRVIIMLRLIV